MEPNDPLDDPAMRRVRRLFRGSGLSMHALGIRMGYGAGHARKSVSQFLKGHDPRISMLRKFAAAVGMSIEELVRPEPSED